MNTLAIWTQAARPRTLVASFSPALIGAALAMSAGIFSPLLFLYTLLTGITIQVATNLANDYFDFLKGADTQERKGPQRVMQAGLATKAQMKWAIALCFALALLLGCQLVIHVGISLLFFLLFYCALSYFYTAGPYPLAYFGLGDLLVLLFYGPGAVALTTYIQTGELTTASLLAGLGPGALSTALLTINNLRDQEEDRKASKRTLIVRWGLRWGKIEYALCLLLSLLPAALYGKSHPFLYLLFLLLLPAATLARALVRAHEGSDYNLLLEKTAQLLWLYTLLFCLGWML